MTSTTGRRIVAAVDGSISSRHAADWAADEAAQRHEPLRLAHSADTTAFAYGARLAPTQTLFDELQAEGRRVLSEVRTAVLDRHPDLEVTVALHMSGPVAALLEESDTALLVVVGSRGTGGFPGIVVGSTAVAVAEHARSPVAVVRGHHTDEAPPTAGPVVVGVDGSPTSNAAVAAAFDEASWRGGNLVAVHAWDAPFTYSPPPNPDRDRWDVAEHEVLAERLAGWQEKYPGVTVRRVVDRKAPVGSLLDHALGARLLVVGSRGHGGFAGLLLGSTSQALVRHATCPVLVVRPRPVS